MLASDPENASLLFYIVLLDHVIVISLIHNVMYCMYTIKCYNLVGVMLFIPKWRSIKCIYTSVMINRVTDTDILPYYSTLKCRRRFLRLNFGGF